MGTTLTGSNYRHPKLLVYSPSVGWCHSNLTPPYQSFRRSRNPSARAQGQNNLDPSEAPPKCHAGCRAGHCSFLQGFRSARHLPSAYHVVSPTAPSNVTHQTLGRVIGGMPGAILVAILSFYDEVEIPILLFCQCTPSAAVLRPTTRAVPPWSGLWPAGSARQRPV